VECAIFLVAHKRAFEVDLGKKSNWLREVGVDQSNIFNDLGLAKGPAVLNVRNALEH
jgi:hypothetical protein